MLGGRRAAALVGGLAVAALALGGLTAVGSAAPAIGLAGSGHWVVNRVANTAVHVDGGTRKVDAQVELPAGSGEPLFVAENERQGFVVSRDRAVVFGRSTLTVDTTVPLNFDEVPVGVETAGGPYLVYRRSGAAVRLGLQPLTIQLGGPVDRPVWTDDGTVWLRRSDDGSLCAVRDGATAPDCPTKTDTGALTITSTVPAFVGSAEDAAQVVEPAAHSAPVPLGTDVPDSLLLSDRDTRGRLPFVVPETNRLVLADSSGVPAGQSGGAAEQIDLGPGRFTSPVASDGVVVLLEEATSRLLAFDISGKLLSSAQLPPGAGASVMRGRDGRIYVDDAGGTATHVVGRDGSVTTVPTNGGQGTVAPPPSQAMPIPNPVAPPPSHGSTVPPINGRASSPNPNPNPNRNPNPNPIPIPVVSPPGPPLALDLGEHQTGGGVLFDITWQQPQLNGGQLVHYIVTGTDAQGGRYISEVTTGTSLAGRAALAQCRTPLTLSVRAVTKDDAGKELQGPEAKATSSIVSDCTVTGSITARSVGPSAVSVDADLHTLGDDVGQSCSLRFNGVSRWSGECHPGSPGGFQLAVVDGLDPATTYRVQLFVNGGPNARPTQSNVVSVTTSVSPSGSVSSSPSPGSSTSPSSTSPRPATPPTTTPPSTEGGTG